MRACEEMCLMVMKFLNLIIKKIFFSVKNINNNKISQLKLYIAYIYTVCKMQF